MVNTAPKRCPTCNSILASDRAPLTSVQARVLAFICRRIKATNVAPALQEIADEFNYGGLSTPHAHLKQLEVKGYIHRDRRRARGITVLVPYDEAAADTQRSAGN